MRRHINIGAAVGFLVLVVLWIVGLAREASVAYPLPTAWHLAVSEELSNRLSRNVITNNLKQIGLAQTPLLLVLDQPDVEKIQVEEKTAQLALGSDAFDDDEAAVRTALAAHHGIVFDEKCSGIAPARRLLLEISVPTDEFDVLLGKLQEIGQLQSISVQKRDRTSEFRRLHTQRQALGPLSHSPSWQGRKWWPCWNFAVGLENAMFHTGGHFRISVAEVDLSAGDDVLATIQGG